LEELEFGETGDDTGPERSLVPAARPLPGGEASLDSMEKEHIIKILRETGGNKKKAAEILGIERRTLYNKAKRLGIDFSSI
jgi:DNA-binding NtrC family response regulator